MKAKLLILTGLLGISSAVPAQYVVGDIQYLCPVGTSWNDPRCIRQPVEQHTVDGAIQSALPPQPDGKWLSKWGAIAVDGVVGDIGAANSELSESEAIHIAISRCEKHGAKKCQTTYIYSNQCAVLAWPSVLRGRVISDSGTSIEVASRKALSECAKLSGAECSIVYSGCSEPVFERM